MLNSWIGSYGSATAAGLDPFRTTTPFYIKYTTNWSSAVPYNFIIDAKTRKILSRGVSYTKLTAEFDKYAK